MNDYVKDGLVFLGGATVAVGVCATVAITTMVRDEDIRNATVAAVSNKITRWLCGDNYYRPLRSRREHVTYRDYYNSKKRSRTLKNAEVIKDGEWYKTPSKKWDKVTSKVSELGTSKIHYVKLPENHIVIDFDIPDKDGNKCNAVHIFKEHWKTIK